MHIQAGHHRERITTVALQSHLDMVHQKNNDTDFDFEPEGIRMPGGRRLGEGRRHHAGPDNGIGVASIMALLASTDIPTPLEALFTIDEETGMTGAFELKGRPCCTPGHLLNLDTEDDIELTIGCAGGWT